MLKQKRKTIALICMILIGIFGSFGFANQSNVVYAEEYSANTNTLSVKCQLPKNASKNDPNTRIRLVSTISEAEVAKISYVGFEIEFLADNDNAAVTMLDINDTVYAGITIDSTDAQGVSYDFTPKVFDIESKYFSTCTISGIPQAYFDNGILVKPFVVERGLNPNVAENRAYGEHRYVKIIDVLSTEDKILSIPVLGEVSDETNVQLDGNSCTVEEKYFDGTYTHIRIEQDPARLASVTTITIGDKTATYRNLYSDTAVDTSWHTDGVGGVIVTEGDLYGFQQLSVQGETFAGETVYLAADIDLNPGWTASATAPTNSWTQINKFEGTFDGDFCTLKGVYSSAKYAGFFYQVTTSGTVQNLLLKNSYFTGGSYSGAIAGWGQGSFSNIYTNATVYGAGQNVGGLVGDCSGGSANVRFTNCWNAGNVKGNNLTGGIFGYAYSCNSVTVLNCLNTGTISDNGASNQMGGICGRVDANATKFTIENCLNVGTVSVNSSNTGAIIGNNGDGWTAFNNVYYLDSSCTPAGGGIFTAEGYTALSASALKSEAGYASTNLPVEYWEYVAGGTPVLRMFSDADSTLSWYLKGNGQDVFVYEISNVAELKGFRYISTQDNFSGDTVRLVKDIVLDESEAWTPIANTNVPFAGTFDGNGKTITGMTIQSASNFNGLFQKVDGATIRDLTLNGAYQAAGSYNGGLIGWSVGNTTISDVDVNVDVPSSGFYVGGLIGAHTTGTLTISDSTCNGTISDSYTSDYAKVGGFVGEAGGTVELSNCRFAGTVVDTSKGRTGGFIGFASGAVTMEKCVLDGTVTGKEFVGGFIGQSTTTVNISDCVQAGEVTGEKYIGGFIGYTMGTVGVSECELLGSVTGNYMGGFMGCVTSSFALQNCLLNGTITGTDLSGGFIGTINASSKTCTIQHCLFGENGQTILTGNQRGGFIGLAQAGTLTIDDCLILGKTNVEANKDWYSLIIGRVAGATVNITNTFVEETQQLTSAQYNSGTLNDTTVIFADASYLQGANAYTKTSLDFDTYWNAVDGGYPELKVFSTNEAMTLPTNFVRADYSWYVRKNYLNGETTNTYTIVDASDLMGVAVVSRVDDFTQDTLKLGNADIVLNEGWTASATAPATVWMPIGSNTKKFAGKFDGNGKTISGMYVNATAEYAGMFASTAATSEIGNFRLENSYISSNANRLGAIVGTGDGTFNKIYSNATVVGKQWIGGMLGGTSGGNVVISECWLEGKLVGTDIKGGFIGQANGGSVSIRNCLNKVDVLFTTENANGGNQTGGYVGQAWNTDFSLTDSLSVGNVKSTSFAGSLVGRIGKGDGKTHAFTISNTYVLDTSHTLTVGANELPAAECNLQDVILKEEFFKGSNAYTKTALDFTNYWRAVEGEYPEVKALKGNTAMTLPAGITRADYRWYGDATYTANGNKYILADASDLIGFTLLSQYNDFAGKNITLGAEDIVLNQGWTASTTAPATVWMPIGNATKQFAGKFDGNGKTISGLYVNATTEYAGMFSVTTASSEVGNFRLENSYISSDQSYLGAIAGIGNGTFNKIYSNATVVGNSFIGGMIGGTNGAVSISECWLEGKVVGVDIKGGFIGRVNGGSVSISNCLNKMNVLYTTENLSKGNQVGGYAGMVWNADFAIADSLSVGSVKAVDNAGSLVGRIGKSDGKTHAFTISNTYALDTSHAATVGTNAMAASECNLQDVMLKDEFLKGSNAYTNTYLDFDNYWRAVEDQYPELQVFP